MRVAVIGPAAGPRTGSRTYAGDIAAVLAEDHELIPLENPAAIASLAADPPRADLLHVLDAKRMLDAAGILERAPLPVVIDLHDDYWTGRPRYPAFDRPARVLRWRRQRPRFLALLRRADAVVVHARHMSAAVPHDRAVVVPIPVRPVPDGPAPAPSGERPLGEPPAPAPARARPRVLFAGRDALRKGLPVLGAALRRLRAEGLVTETLVAGGDWPHLRAAARWWMRGLPAVFPGDLSAEAMTRAYAEADLVAVPSYTEAFGLVAQEALARGVPVVASRAGGLEEILTPPSPVPPGLSGEPGGLLVPPGDPGALAAAIRTILSDAGGWRGRAREAGRTLAALRTPDAARLALATAYETALAHRRAGR